MKGAVIGRTLRSPETGGLSQKHSRMAHSALKKNNVKNLNRRPVSHPLDIFYDTYPFYYSAGNNSRVLEQSNIIFNLWLYYQTITY